MNRLRTFAVAVMLAGAFMLLSACSSGASVIPGVDAQEARGHQVYVNVSPVNAGGGGSPGGMGGNASGAGGQVGGEESRGSASNTASAGNTDGTATTDADATVPLP